LAGLLGLVGQPDRYGVRVGLRKSRLGTPYKLPPDDYLRQEARGYVHLLASSWQADAETSEWLADHRSVCTADELAAAFLSESLRGVTRRRRRGLRKRQVSLLYQHAYDLNRALPFYAWRNFADNVLTRAVHDLSSESDRADP
jgi:hypothetical protein